MVARYNFANNLIDQVFYINLDYRIDRDQNIKFMIDNILHIPSKIVQRFPAIDYSKNPNFIKRCIGCAKSHLEIWEKTVSNHYKYIIVLEDDVVPIRLAKNISHDIVQLITKYPDFNICNMAYSTKEPLETDPNLKDFYHSHNIQTASAYILNSDFAKILIETTDICIDNLSNNMDPNENAVDQCWKKLQINNPMWFVMKRSFKQIESYSDLEHRIVNYNL
jgi:GR25 family glycosyltransferase involved in LPS biosynthesis